LKIAKGKLDGRNQQQIIRDRLKAIDNGALPQFLGHHAKRNQNKADHVMQRVGVEQHGVEEISVI
jgi:hypothetical protein